ncbi:Type 1 glutamine amidotransferase-like domain-containing protein [Paenibacillus barcinonensis]|uniref:Dipeptidase E n=1 Tax=Paenibacillus barcinonensis TaxID=198119 RepID=A0A2V4VEN8_PAEBA|nr:Type 1 glutamine amidotransferase-like domain-containing protein [Paenibacillus barcinonensis]PYE47176.1 dipeptidase E [Paenibacillus barcinonensis]QKS58657.1 Type 1 glutamine amidotransferase-like domain-containing protein [Paenibacillus barcinonensis]
MKKLFLSASFEETASLLHTLGEDLAGRRVTFIPTASVTESYDAYVHAGRQALEQWGLIVEDLEVSTAAPEEVTNKLEQSDLIYVSGGNTFFLLQELRRSGAESLIRAHIQAGKIYIGESAGSIILAPDIAYVKAMDDCAAAPDLSDYRGLNAVDFYPVPHVGCFPFVESAAQVIAEYESTLSLVPITNAQVIVMNGEQHRIVEV